MPPLRLPPPVVLAGILLATAGCGGEPPWNVLLVTWDTTRADHLGCYGNETISTPVADALAAEGVLFERAYSTVPMTLPSHTTILTGRYPTSHGVRDNGLFVVPPEVETLAELLAARGYRTGAAVAAFPLVRRFGLDQGFDLYDDRLEGGGRTSPRFFFEQRPAGRVNEAALDWLGDGSGEPFFLWAHYYDPHQPFQPPPPYDQLYADDPYDGEIAYADESLGVLLDRLAELGVDGRTLVVLTADHGEGLGEHGEATHSFLVYDTTLHVPLVVRTPDGPRGVRVADRVGTVDLAPTVLDLLGVPAPAEMEGRSLAGYLGAGAPRTGPRSLYAETLSPRLTNGWGELRALLHDGWKYIHGPRPELYAIESDPHELDDRVASEPQVAAEMKAKLAAFLSRATAGASAAVPADEETRERLAALGYLSTEGVTGPIREELTREGTPPQDRVGDVSRVTQARNLLVEGRALAAREAALELVAADPENPFYLEMLAVAEAELGRVDAALATLDRIPADAPRRATRGRLLLLIGRRLFLDGRREEGLARVRESVAGDPSAEGLHLLSTMLAAAGERAAADRALDEALELDAAYGPARVDRAIRRATEGRAAEAEEEFRRALADDPYLARGHYNYGAFLVAEGRAGEAIGRFRRALELDRGYADAYLAAIRLELAAGRDGEAAELAAELQRRAPASPEAAEVRRLLAEPSPAEASS